MFNLRRMKYNAYHGSMPLDNIGDIVISNIDKRISDHCITSEDCDIIINISCLKFKGLSTITGEPMTSCPLSCNNVCEFSSFAFFFNLPLSTQLMNRVNSVLYGISKRISLPVAKINKRPYCLSLLL